MGEHEPYGRAQQAAPEGVIGQDVEVQIPPTRPIDASDQPVGTD